mmetsp:Transcript_43021/g.115205  ORF Transcript_43021/g.115205 Transcript_43021/m.115205 type:complete len:82 (+) Transcript_43021:842-1087(+)
MYEMIHTGHMMVIAAMVPAAATLALTTLDDHKTEAAFDAASFVTIVWKTCDNRPSCSVSHFRTRWPLPGKRAEADARHGSE